MSRGKVFESKFTKNIFFLNDSWKMERSTFYLVPWLKVCRLLWQSAWESRHMDQITWIFETEDREFKKELKIVPRHKASALIAPFTPTPIPSLSQFFHLSLIEFQIKSTNVVDIRLDQIFNKPACFEIKSQSVISSDPRFSPWGVLSLSPTPLKTSCPHLNNPEKLFFKDLFKGHEIHYLHDVKLISPAS